MERANKEQRTAFGLGDDAAVANMQHSDADQLDTAQEKDDAREGGKAGVTTPQRRVLVMIQPAYR